MELMLSLPYIPSQTLHGRTINHNSMPSAPSYHCRMGGGVWLLLNSYPLRPCVLNFPKHIPFALHLCLCSDKKCYLCRRFSENRLASSQGERVEWSITTVLKTVALRGAGGSNPSLSANRLQKDFTRVVNLAFKN